MGDKNIYTASGDKVSSLIQAAKSFETKNIMSIPNSRCDDIVTFTTMENQKRTVEDNDIPIRAVDLKLHSSFVEATQFCRQQINDPFFITNSEHIDITVAIDNCIIDYIVIGTRQSNNPIIHLKTATKISKD